MQDNCIFLPRVKSRRCANILRASGYLEYSRIWLLFSPDNTAQHHNRAHSDQEMEVTSQTQAPLKCVVFTARGERAITNRNLLHV